MKELKIFGLKKLIKQLKTLKNPIFLCVMGTTETSKIPGISAAGSTPENTKYTPSADAEIITIGHVECTENIPQSPFKEEKLPTPALITKACLNITKNPVKIIDVGFEIKPHIKTITLNKNPTKDIQTGKAVENAEKIFNKAKKLNFQDNDYLIIGESIPGGTTTALGVLKSLGYDAEYKVSGSALENPHELKIKVVNKGLKNAGILNKKPKSPFDGIKAVGDAMIPAVAGIILKHKNKPIILAGGTQMTAVCALIKELEPKFDFTRIIIATTSYVAGDQSANIIDIAKQIDKNITICSVNPEFEKTDNTALNYYPKGHVKEGVGAGGMLFASLIQGYTMEKLREEIVKEVIKNN